MKLEAVEPAHRGFASASHSLEDPVVVDAAVVATTREVASIKAIPVFSPRRVWRSMHIGVSAVGISATNRL